ncbi:MAG: hypothetical protein QOJ64_2824 [Acidobacteriota bacterium]|jgi:hypothetical protein|nr:hypothetical protein [Acidobacteriota bacterium]
MRISDFLVDPHAVTPRRYLSICTTFLLIAVALALGACGKSGEGGAAGGGIHVKAPGMDERDITAKSGAAYAVTKSFTDKENKITTAASYRVYVANYDLDPSQYAMSMNKPLTADDQARVVFSLVGEEGTKDPSPLKAGTYAAKADKFMKVEDVSIVSRKGGQDNEINVDRSGLTGEVKIASVSGDTVSGELNLTSGDTSIKGPFTAKVLKR